MPEKTLRDKVADKIKQYKDIEAYLLAGQIITVLPEQPKGMSEVEIQETMPVPVPEEKTCTGHMGTSRVEQGVCQTCGLSVPTPEVKTCENCGYNHCTTKNKYVACSEWKKKEVVELPEDLPVFFPDDTVSMIETQAAMVLMRDYINKILRYLRQREERG